MQNKGFLTDLKLKKESEESGSIFSHQSYKYGDDFKKDRYFEFDKKKK